MKNRKKLRKTAMFSIALALGLGLCSVLIAETSPALDSGTGLINDTTNAASIGDLYVFESPEKNENAVLALTVNCGQSAGKWGGLDDSVLYEFKIDSDGDKKSDHSFKIRSRGDRVRVKGYNLDIQGEMNQTLTNSEGNARFFVGPVDNPFFGDLESLAGVLSNSGSFSGVDTRAGTNCTAIVIEMPRSWLAGGAQSTALNVWATTTR